MENISLKLDYSLKTETERNEYVKKIIANASPSQLTSKYLEILADYILGAMPKEDKKERAILTDNRLVTVNKRETSYENLVSKFENGEDGLYNLIIEDKNVILTPKVEITQEDIDEIPGMRELRENIARIEEQAKRATGKKKYLLKKQAIEMRQDQYVLKNFFRNPIYASHTSNHNSHQIELPEHIWFNADGEPESDDLVSLFNYKHISAILCNYEMLNNALKYKFSSDFHYLMEDFNALMEKTLKKYPFYADLVQLKLDGKSNLEIQKYLYSKYGIKHSVEYISALWRNKIPKLLAEQAKEDYIIWYYTHVEKGVWKRCSRCGQLKLAHSRFFSKNSTSKDGWYSICKECRNKKR